MNQGKLVFARLLPHLPLAAFRRCAVRHRGEHKVQSLSCLDQFLRMAFAQLTRRESLRAIEACLRARHTKLYHLGIRAPVPSRESSMGYKALQIGCGIGRIAMPLTQSLRGGRHDGFDTVSHGIE